MLNVFKVLCTKRSFPGYNFLNIIYYTDDGKVVKVKQIITSENVSMFGI